LIYQFFLCKLWCNYVHKAKGDDSIFTSFQLRSGNHSVSLNMESNEWHMKFCWKMVNFDDEKPDRYPFYNKLKKHPNKNRSHFIISSSSSTAPEFELLIWISSLTLNLKSYPPCISLRTTKIRERPICSLRTTLTFKFENHL